MRNGPPQAWMSPAKPGMGQTQPGAPSNGPVRFSSQSSASSIAHMHPPVDLWVWGRRWSHLYFCLQTLLDFVSSPPPRRTRNTSKFSTTPSPVRRFRRCNFTVCRPAFSGWGWIYQRHCLLGSAWKSERVKDPNHHPGGSGFILPYRVRRRSL